MELTMKEYIENNLYSELIQNPLWTQAAFGSLKEGDILKTEDSRYILLKYLVTSWMMKVPKELFDTEYERTWRLKDFVECVKAAVKQTKKYN